jgi:DedD protein
MERKLKERVVGAVFLVLAAVLIIPLFLDGPDPQPAGSRPSVSLPPAEDSDGRTSTVRLDQARDTPIVAPLPADAASTPPATTAADAAGGDAPVVAATPPLTAPRTEPAAGPVSQSPAAPIPVAAAPAPAVIPSAPPAPAAAPGEGGWVVQLGAFGNPEGAERVVADLRARRYQGFVTRHEANGRTLHRVRVGPAGSREEADRLQQRLAADGFPGQPVRE